MLPITRATRIGAAFSLIARARWKTVLFLFAVALLLAGGAAAIPTSTLISRPPSAPASAHAPAQNSGIQVGHSYSNDVSPALRDMPQGSVPANDRHQGNKYRELSVTDVDKPGPALQDTFLAALLGLDMPGPILNFDGISCVGCSGLPRTDGEVGATQYVQIVADSYEIFDKATGASISGPATIASLFAGFGGVCQSSSQGHGLVLYDQLAGRWLISQVAGSAAPTDECIAISTTSDATGTWNRYAFHLAGGNFLSEPRLSVWPDAYYMSVNVFNASGTTFLGPQPFAFDRSRMLAGLSTTVITPGITGGPGETSYLPADLDGSTMPPVGAPNPFLEFPSTGTYRLFHFHADFATPANSTFTLFASPPAAAFTPLCPGTRACVPQLGSTNVDGVGGRLMFRLAYRNFGTPYEPNESMVGNYSVSSNGVAGVHWFELKSVTAGPAMVAQESTYQPDTTWRWFGSAAMDHAGDFAVGFSASDATIYPQIRYAGRLATDPPNTLAQGEAHLFDGTASSGSTDWGEYSVMTVDPVDDCTFWYTNQYYATPGSAGHTRIGNFRFAECGASATPTPTPTATHFEIIAPSVVGMFLGFNFTVRALDQFNNTATGYTGTVHFTTTSQSSLLPPDGTLTNGFGTFSADLQNKGVQTITATDTVNPSITGTSNDILVVSDIVTPPPSPTATPTPATPTPTITPTPTPTPSSTPAAQLLNLSTRLRVQTGENVGIGGFIITGNDPKRVIVRGLGPSLPVSDPLADPVLELHGPGAVIFTNDNWRDTQEAEIIATGLQPPNDLESAIVATVNPGAYTAIFSGNNNTSGVALIEVYDLNSATTDSKLANISTRAFVGTGSNVLIAGFILGGNSATDNVVLRGLGPSLPVNNPLADPTFELHDSNGALLVFNDSEGGCAIPPPNPLEPCIDISLPPGSFTAILAGKNGGTGVGLVEVYDLAQP